MTRKVFVFIQENTVKCYPNLSQLAKEHKIPYFSASRSLAKFNFYTKDNYTIHVDTMVYTTHRTNPNNR